MAEPNVYMLEPKLKWYQELLGYMARDLKVMDPDVIMYVPGKFVLKPFKKRYKGLILELDWNRIKYYDSPENLKIYREYFDKGELKVVKSGVVQENELESIIKQAKNYFKTEEQLANEVDSLVKNLKN